MKLPAILRVATLCLSVPSLLWAFNHPEIKWQSVRTEHFIIHFYDKTEPAVYPCWKIAEESYEQLAKSFGYKPRRGKIHLSLADYDDFSNGYASWLEDNVQIWLPDAHFDLRSNTTWLRNVLTHELTHIFSLAPQKSSRTIDWSLSLGASYSDSSQNSQIAFGIPVPKITFYPMWLAEGMAQYGAQLGGNDCWDSRRDMALRCAILANRQLSIDAMAHFSHDRIGNELVYNQGYSFVRYLAQSVGNERLVRLFRQGNLGSSGFASLFAVHMGASVEQLHEKWLNDTRSRYEAMLPSSPTQLTPLSHQGSFNLQPQKSSDGRLQGWLSSMQSDGSETALLITECASGREFLRIDDVQPSWSFNPSGSAVYYIGSQQPNRQGSFLNDLYRIQTATGRRSRLTRDGRIYALACSPTPGRLALIRFNEGIFSLALYDESSAALTPLIDGEQGSPFMELSFNPQDGNQLVVSRVVNGKSGLYRVDIAAHTITPLTSGTYQEESPQWAQDGRIYYSADYDGIFNIYSVAADGSAMHRHSNVIGGIFSPFTQDGSALLASNYTANGFGTVSFTPLREPFSPAAGEKCPFRPLDIPGGTVKISSKAYTPVLGNALISMQSAGEVHFVRSPSGHDTASGFIGHGIGIYRTDALGKRMVQLSLAAGIPFQSIDTTSAAVTLQPPTPFQNRQLDNRSAPHILAQFSTPFLSAASQWRTEGAHSLAEETQEESSAPPIIAIVQPAISFESRALAPTIGVKASLDAMYVIPFQLNIAPYLSQQIARDWHWGIEATCQIPFFPTPLVAATLPLWLRWQHHAYLNQDFDYNLRTLWQAEASVVPEHFYIQTITSDHIYYDTTYEPTQALNYNAQLLHGLPLGARSSLIIGASLNYLQLSAPLTSEDINNEFTFAQRLNTRAMARLTMPLARNIDRGTPYVDNLYGYLMSSIDYRKYSPHEPNVADSLTRKLDYLLGGGIVMGLTQHFAYQGYFEIYGGYEVKARRFQFKLSLR